MTWEELFPFNRKRGLGTPRTGLFSHQTLVRGLLSLAFLFSLGLAPPARAADTNPSNDSAAMRVRIRPRDIFRPVPITDLDAAITFNEGEILLQWTAPDSDGLPNGGGPPVSAYYIRYATFSASDLAGDTTAWWNMASDTHTTTTTPQPHPQVESEILTGLEPGATLYFGIKSRDAAGNLSFIDELSETGPQANAIVQDLAPPVVTGLSIAVSFSSITVSWIASTAADAADYKIYWDTSAPQNIFVPTVTVPAGTTFYAFNNLVKDNTYYFYVTVLDKGQPQFLGNILESSPSSVVSGYPPPVNTPSNLGAVSIGTNTITWQWTDNANNEDRFDLFSDTGGFVGTAAASAGTGGTVQFVESNLTPNASYARYVMAFNGVAPSLASNTTARYTLANAPTGTAFTAVFSSSVVLNWSANSNDPATVYTVQRTSASAGFGQVDFQTEVAGLTFTDTGLSGSTTYFYRVYAQNGEGVVTAFDNTASTRTQTSPITGLSAAPGDQRVELDWDDSTDPSVTGYFVYRSLLDVGPFAKLNLTAISTSAFTDTGLINGVTYFYAVTTVDAGSNESAFSQIVSARPRKPTVARPQEPTGMFGFLSSTGAFNLSWTAVTLDITLSTRVELSSYRIYKSSALEGPFYYRDSVAPDITSWMSPDLVPPTVWYMVRAVDTSGNESDDSMSVETQAVPIITVVSKDGTARVVFTGEDTNALRGGLNGRSEDVRILIQREKPEEQGNVLGSYKIKSMGAASGSEIKELRFARPTVNLQFRYTKGLKAPYIKPGMAFRYAGSSLKDVGIFWHNQVEFVKFGGIVDEFIGVVSVKSASPLGRYQVRHVLRGTEFAITQITPRKIFTPNGDGVNDEIILFLENPNDSIISQARIFDLTGADVAEFEQGVVAGQQGVISLKWNGKDRAGNYVRSGVYIYQVKAEGKTLNGTMVVAR